jgi:hypothetical protein
VALDGRAHHGPWTKRAEKIADLGPATAQQLGMEPDVVAVVEVVP